MHEFSAKTIRVFLIITLLHIKYEQRNTITNIHIDIGVRDHFIFCPNSSSLPEKSNMFGAMHFCLTWGGGGGGEGGGELLFWSD